MYSGTISHIVSLLLVLISSTHARVVYFKNSCPFSIDVEASPNNQSPFIACSGVAHGAQCSWTVPGTGWAGNFHRHNSANNAYGFPSATLAELKLGDSTHSAAFNYDWYDISIIPPGCPGSITSYDGCWCNSNEDGYDVGMTITPAKCQSQSRTCLGRDCAGAYLFPNDNSKTSACTDPTGDITVEFCPSGSFVDVGATATSQTAPCKGGGSPPPPSSHPPPPPPPPAKSSSGIQWTYGVGWAWASGCDFTNNDIGTAQTAAANCGPTCQANSKCTHFAWTPPANCWMKGNSVSISNAFASSTAGIVCGLSTSSSRAIADTSFANAEMVQQQPTTSASSEFSSPLVQGLIASVAVLLVVLVVLIVVYVVSSRKRTEEKV